MKFSAALLVASACLVASVAGQSSPPTPTDNRPNELKFNGNQGETPSNNPSDTSIITDDNKNNVRPNNNNNNNQPPSSNTDLQQLDSADNDMFQNFGFGGGFGGGPHGGFGGGFGGPMIRPGGGLLSQLLGGNIFDAFHRHDQMFNRQFEQLRKQAEQGEGQSVSYFDRNGERFVRTCTTKRLDGNNKSE